jgi:hypothetical protein
MVCWCIIHGDLSVCLSVSISCSFFSFSFASWISESSPFAMSTVEIMRGTGILIRAMVYVSCVLSVFFFCGFYANTHMSAWLGVTSWVWTGFHLFAFSRIRCIQFALLSWRRFFSDRIDYLLAGVCRSICFGIWFWNLRTSRKYGSDSRLSIEWCHSCASSWFLVSFGFNSEAPDWSSRRASVFSSPFPVVREGRRRL